MSGLEPGSTVGRYTILARIRAGAMGALYLARATGAAPSAKPVALKILHDHLAQNERFRRMFFAEAKVATRIDDPHVVRVDELGEADGRYFLVMDYIHGVSLAQALGILRKRGGLPVDVSVAIASDIANGLHAAHEARNERGEPLGIVHRDVSPHNVLVSYDGQVKVIDFGIAKAKESAGQTMTGSIRGKLAYMPPEQARSAKHVDRRADLYAVGLVLWEMLVGRRMFQGKSDIALLNQIRSPTIIAPSAANARVPKELDAVVLQLLEQDPRRRPGSGAEVARLLAQAWPASTQVRAADIAACMKTVRDAAKGIGPSVGDETITASGEHEEIETDDFIQEVNAEATLFDQGMEDNKTAIMPAPVSSAPLPPIEDPPGADEITRNGRVRPRASQAPYPVMLVADVPPPLVTNRKEEERPQEKPPFWLSGPVLGVLTVVFIVLFAMFAGVQFTAIGRSQTPLTTSGTQNPNRTPLENAREASAEGNFAGVRELLEKHVKGGKATTEEVQLVLGACMQMGDRKCVNEVSAKYPSVPRPESIGKP